MAFATETRSINAGIVDRMSAYARGIAARYSQYRVYRQTVVELSRLTARELDDLGIHRSMISSIAHEAAYGK